MASNKMVRLMLLARRWEKELIEIILIEKVGRRESWQFMIWDKNVLIPPDQNLLMFFESNIYI